MSHFLLRGDESNSGFFGVVHPSEINSPTFVSAPVTIGSLTTEERRASRPEQPVGTLVRRPGTNLKKRMRVLPGVLNEGRRVA